MRRGFSARLGAPNRGDVTTPLKSVKLTRLVTFSALTPRIAYGADPGARTAEAECLRETDVEHQLRWALAGISGDQRPAGTRPHVEVPKGGRNDSRIAGGPGPRPVEKQQVVVVIESRS